MSQKDLKSKNQNNKQSYKYYRIVHNRTKPFLVNSAYLILTKPDTITITTNNTNHYLIQKKMIDGNKSDIFIHLNHIR